MSESEPLTKEAPRITSSINIHTHTHTHTHTHMLTELYLSERCVGDFPGGPVVKIPPCSAGVTGPGTKIPHAAE